MKTRTSGAFIILFILVVLAQNPAVGRQKAFDFGLVDIHGQEFVLSDHLGKVVLIEFFATYCGACRQEILELKNLWQRFSSSHLLLISVSVDASSDSENVLLDFIEEYGMQWIVARDTAGISSQYGVSAIPTLVLVDRDGYIAYRHVGLTRVSILSQEIDGLLQGTASIQPESTSSVGFWRNYIMLFLAIASIVAVTAILLLRVRYKRVTA